MWVRPERPVKGLPGPRYRWLKALQHWACRMRGRASCSKAQPDEAKPSRRAHSHLHRWSNKSGYAPLLTGLAHAYDYGAHVLKAVD